MTIWFDSDGVLCNLTKHISEVEGYECPLHWYLNYTKATGDPSFNTVIRKHVANDLFYNCPPMDNYEKIKVLIQGLKNRGYSCKVLTSVLDYDYSDLVAEQKHRWFKKHFSNVFDEVVTVKGSKEKINYIKDGDILIDDYVKTKKQFEDSNKSNQFILYTNFDKLVYDLDKLDIFNK